MNNEKTTQKSENMLPVFRFDLENRLIYANDPALPLMKEWKCTINQKIPAVVISRYPELFHASMSHRATDMTVEFNNCMIHFSIVPFPEAGYLGMYAYAMESSGKYTTTKKASDTTSTTDTTTKTGV